MDRPDVTTRISKLKAEIDRLRSLAEACHPTVISEIDALADDMKSHVTVLERFLANDPGRLGREGAQNEVSHQGAGRAVGTTHTSHRAP